MNHTLTLGSVPFEVVLHEPLEASQVVLFAAGAGGSPERHAPLLEALAGCGLAVVAPHFERLVSPRPSMPELIERMGRIRVALDTFGRSRPVVGVGHSIGASLLLAAAGATMWLGPGSSVPHTQMGLTRLVLMAPPTGFFAVPGALDAVNVPILLWSGARDTITPPAQAEVIKRALGDRVDLRMVEAAGHFTFMHSPPPHVVDDVEGRDVILETLTRQTCHFAREAKPSW